MAISFQGLLVLLQSSEGVNAGIGVLLSFVVEYWPAYGALEPKVKRLLMLVFCLVIPLAAAGASVALGYQPLSWEGTFWPALVAGASAFAGATIAHMRKLAG